MDPAPLDPQPVTLTGRLVGLEPLALSHLDGLCAVGFDPSIWLWMQDLPTTRETMTDHLERALATAATGAEVPFATLDLASGAVVGSTRYLNIERHHRRLEIGYTWLAPPWQGSGLNSEAKLLLMEHAFERLGCHRVEFKTDSLNERSRAALRGIGATEEGIFRNHMVTRSGRLRHSAYYSVIDDEWPVVKDRLAAKLESRGSPHSR